MQQGQILNMVHKPVVHMVLLVHLSYWLIYNSSCFSEKDLLNMFTNFFGQKITLVKTIFPFFKATLIKVL